MSSRRELNADLQNWYAPTSDVIPLYYNSKKKAERSRLSNALSPPSGKTRRVHDFRLLILVYWSSTFRLPALFRCLSTVECLIKAVIIAANISDYYYRIVATVHLHRWLHEYMNCI